MAEKLPKVVIVMPAFNAERTVKETFKEIPEKYKKYIILVDDKSDDNTVKIAEKLGIKVFTHTKNLGYGGNQKTCYWEALKLNPDVVVMLHPDYQYDASLMEELVRPILEDRYDYMFGSRIATKKTALQGGMPPLKYYVNRIVCFLQNILLEVNFTEHFSGYRAYSRKFLKTVPFQRFSNDFVFDQEMTISGISHGMRIGEVAIPTRYHDKASSIKILKGTKFILEGFMVTARFLLNSFGLLNDLRFKSNKQSDRAILLIGLFIAIFYMYLKGILVENIFLTFTIIACGLFFYLHFTRGKLLSMTLFFIVLISVYALNYNFDSSLLTPTSLETSIDASRQEYFADGLEIIYKNQFGLLYFNEVRPFVNRYTQNIFANLGFETLFNLNSIWSIPLFSLFLIGTVKFLRKANLNLIIIFLFCMIISGFLTASTILGGVMLMPFVIMTYFLGIKNIINKKLL